MSPLALPRIQDACKEFVGLNVTRSITEPFDDLRLAGRDVIVRMCSKNDTYVTTHVHTWADDAVKKVLVVLTGNGNDIIDNALEGYQAVVSVTWSDDHTKAPMWLPDYLVALAKSMRPLTGEVDLYGYSRGACALFHCCRSDVGRPEDLVNVFDSIGFAAASGRLGHVQGMSSRRVGWVWCGWRRLRGR